jgi:hypothetical protein
VSFIFSSTDNNTIDSQLERLEVPKQMVMFYKPSIVKKMGKKFKGKSNYYVLNQFLFKITGDKFEKIYYNIEYLSKNPQILK